MANVTGQRIEPAVAAVSALDTSLARIAKIPYPRCATALRFVNLGI